MKNAITLTSMLATLLASQVYSAEMFKCVDASGHVTFVQHQCPGTAEQSDTLDVNNLPPSGAGTPSQMADPAILENRQTVQLTVVDSGPKPRDMSPQSPIQKEMEATRKTKTERMKNEATRTTE